MVVVLRDIHVAVAGWEADGRVDQHGRRSEAAVNRRGVDYWLEGRTELSVGLCGSVELAAVEIPPPGHRADLARLVVDREQRTLNDRRLLERNGQCAGR